MKRKIVEIDEEKCNGCGLCIPNCHEGALKIVDGKAKLASEVYCDGLGDCLGHCPEDAIRVVEKDVKEFDFKSTNKHLKEIGREKLKENPMEKRKDEDKMKPDLACGCPGTMERELKKEETSGTCNKGEIVSQLQQWPVQLKLLSPGASFFQDADLLIAADCVGFASPNFHNQLLKGKILVIGCPKLDDLEEYKKKIRAIIDYNDLNTITVAVMEVPCCSGMYKAVEEALDESGKRITLKKIVVGVDGSKS